MAGFGTVGTQQRDAAILIALDLQFLAFERDELRLVIARGFDADRILLAVKLGPGLGRLAAKTQREIAQRHQYGAKLHGFLGAQIIVGQQAADQRGEIDQRGEAAIEAGGRAVGKQEMVGEIERQQRPHAVITEPLHGFGGEQPRQLRRVAEPLRAGICRRRARVLAQNVSPSRARPRRAISGTGDSGQQRFRQADLTLAARRSLFGP